MANFSIRAVIGATTAPFQRALSGLNGFVRRTFSGIGGVLAGVFSVSLVRGLFDEFDRLAKLARQLRLPAETVQRFSVVAQLGGTNVEAFSKGLLQAERNAIKAEQGLTTYQRAFDDLGISTRDFLGLDAEGQLLALADAYSETENQGRAVAALQETLGRSGRELIPTLEAGADGVRELLDSIDTLDEADFSAIENANDQLTILGNNIKVSVIPFIVDLVGFIAFLTTRMRQGIVIIREYGGELLKLTRVLNPISLARSLANGDSLLPDFSAATSRTGDELEALENQLDDFIRRSERTIVAPVTPEDVQGLESQSSTLEKLRDLQEEYNDRLEQGRAAARGFSAEIDFLDAKVLEIEQELTGLGEVGTNAEANARILELTRERLSLETQIAEINQRGTEERARQLEAQNSGLNRLATERKILELRAAGDRQGADLLERQAESVRLAREFLDQVGVAFEGANAEAAVAEFQEILRLREEAEEESAERSRAIVGSFRNVGANDPIGVALSGPFDKQLEAQRETKRAVEEQTSAVVNAVGEVREAVEGAGIGTVQFARLN